MDEDNIDIRIRMCIDFSKFESFDLVNIYRRALIKYLVSSYPPKDLKYK